jgi:hypothetical protein
LAITVEGSRAVVTKTWHARVKVVVFCGKVPQAAVGGSREAREHAGAWAARTGSGKPGLVAPRGRGAPAMGIEACQGKCTGMGESKWVRLAVRGTANHQERPRGREQGRAGAWSATTPMEGGQGGRRGMRLVGGAEDSLEGSQREACLKR